MVGARAGLIGCAGNICMAYTPPGLAAALLCAAVAITLGRARPLTLRWAGPSLLIGLCRIGDLTGA